MLSSQVKRIFSAVVFLPLFILLVIKGSPVGFCALAAVVAILGLGEFFKLKKEGLPGRLRIFGYFWGLLIILSAYIGGVPLTAASFAGGFIISFLIRLKTGTELENALDELGFLVFGVTYVAFFTSYLVHIMGADNGPLWLLLLFTITWGGDTAAYYTGMNLGRRKLYPEISPKKSVEGFLGGFAGGMLASLLFKALFFAVPSLFDSLLIAAGIGIIGPLGDLCESMLKRSSGVKDSGGVIPGHGGILDRLDSVLFSAPFLYYFIGMRGYI